MPATKVAEKRMNLQEIKDKARALSITPGKLKKTELIHNIQVAEGCAPCYGTSNGQCSYTDCCFMTDCFKAGS